MSAAGGDYVGGGPPKFTRLSKMVSAVLVALWALALIYPPSLEYLALIPGRTLPCVWNLLTASFVNTTVPEVLFAVAALLLLARIIEPIYGSTEFLRLLVVVATTSSTITFVGAYIFYLTSPDKDGSVLYNKFTGFHGVVGGLMVAVKQIMADQDVKLGGVLRLPARYLPSVYVLVASAVAGALGRWSALSLLLLGTYCAWVYLRFFQWQPETTLHGDPSEDFRLSSFFPPAVQAPIDAVGRVCSVVFCLRHSPEAVAASSGVAEARALLAATGGGGGGGSGDPDANRRRERGAKALEERLMAGKAAAAGSAAAAADAADRMESGAGES